MGPSSSREWNAADYHRVSQPQLSWGKKVLARLRLRGDETVLDAGCGSGRLTAELLEALPKGHVVGVDLSSNMLNIAREHLQPRFEGRVEFIACDLLHLPFENSFDGIVSTAAFHWVLDHDDLFQNLRRALRAGGWLEAQCGGAGNLARLRERMKLLAALPKYAPFLGGYPEPWLFQDAENAATALRRAGFVEIETGLEPALTVFEGREAYVEFLKTVVVRTYLGRLPDPELQAQYLSDLADQAAHDDPPFALDYWRLNLSAKTPA